MFYIEGDAHTAIPSDDEDTSEAESSEEESESSSSSVSPPYNTRIMSSTQQDNL